MLLCLSLTLEKLFLIESGEPFFLKEEFFLESLDLVSEYFENPLFFLIRELIVLDSLVRDEPFALIFE